MCLVICALASLPYDYLASFERKSLYLAIFYALNAINLVSTPCPPRSVYPRQAEVAELYSEGYLLLTSRLFMVVL